MYMSVSLFYRSLLLLLPLLPPPPPYYLQSSDMELLGEMMFGSMPIKVAGSSSQSSLNQVGGVGSCDLISRCSLQYALCSHVT